MELILLPILATYLIWPPLPLLIGAWLICPPLLILFVIFLLVKIAKR